MNSKIENANRVSGGDRGLIQLHTTLGFPSDFGVEQFRLTRFNESLRRERMAGEAMIHLDSSGRL